MFYNSLSEARTLKALHVFVRQIFPFGLHLNCWLQVTFHFPLYCLCGNSNSEKFCSSATQQNPRMKPGPAFKLSGGVITTESSRGIFTLTYSSYLLGAYAVTLFQRLHFLFTWQYPPPHSEAHTTCIAEHALTYTTCMGSLEPLTTEFTESQFISVSENQTLHRLHSSIPPKHSKHPPFSAFTHSASQEANPPRMHSFPLHIQPQPEPDAFSSEGFADLSFESF
jgi:hypothetical protein